MRFEDPRIVLYKRYIDDILIIWKGSSEQLTEYIRVLNTNEYNFKFTDHISNKSVVFLDLELAIENDKEIITRTHFKQVDTNSYLKTFIAATTKNGI
ncbi:hypothetical protein GDO78_014998 [Eleutherodactylus coqui]|uniref:Reverse transcriptase domain-containing protein n=1 Tax=Eleutherodactylus coqui TaxID=57060 RepID=A0A8J6B629_ELECQ|nr:hypothetical protein GDO78_014998 [Eleutherodactylus coqui]